MARHHATTPRKRKIVKAYKSAKKAYKKVYPKVRKMKKMI